MMTKTTETMLKTILKKTVNSPAETDELAAAFAGQLKPGDVVALYGNLGAGKTHFVKAVCRKLQVENVATSPTFTIVNEYQCDDGQLVYHFDFYRIEHVAELVNLGLEDYFFSDNICFIEWPEKIGDRLPKQRYEVYLDFVENQPTTRLIRVVAVAN